jgi:putative nucleotidyltransferase with HDIG domain
MIIECSLCAKKFKIREDLLPKGKIVTFPCKNCGDNFRLDLRNEKPIIEKSNGLAPGDTDSAANSQAVNETDDKSLKDQILKSVKELPPMPQVVVKTKELMAGSNVDSAKIASIIETDQGIATKVLKVANSSYYGLSGKISSISHASVVLGNQLLEEVVTLAGTEGILDGKLAGYGYDSKDLWKHSLAVAFGSKMLSDSENADLVKEAHMAGLIHDVGKIILDSYIVEQKEEIDSYMEKEEKAFLDAESQYFGFNHAEIAAEVCKKWKFPDSLNDAIKYHHEPGKSDGNELAYILHMADYIAITGGIGYDNDDILFELEKGTMDHLNLTNEGMSEMVLKVAESVSQISM